METLTCANCAYEIDEVNQVTLFCQTCQRAYEIGTQRTVNDIKRELEEGSAVNL